MKTNNEIHITKIETELGEMFSLSSEEYLYLLEFNDTHKKEKKLIRFKKFFGVDFIESENEITAKVKEEIELYFSGNLFQFTVPIKLFGTDFQKKVWKELMKIPYGQTISYKELAFRVGNEKAYRAVANANGANSIPIIIPCHRVINKNGNMGGFSAGIHRKKWLLEHERKCKGSRYARR